MFVFRDDHPLNGEHDAGGGLDVLSPERAWLGGFNITIFDDVGGTGDAAGQLTYDEFGQPLSNALAGDGRPGDGRRCLLGQCNREQDFDGATSDTGITLHDHRLPELRSGRHNAVPPRRARRSSSTCRPDATASLPHQARTAFRWGEEWVAQTNTLDGGKAHDAFLKVGEPQLLPGVWPARVTTWRSASRNPAVHQCRGT